VKPLAVLDSSVVVSGIGWAGGNARTVLVLLARRAFISVRTPWLTDEWTDVVQRVAEESPRWQNPNWPRWLDWLKRASTLVEDPPIKRIVRSDPKDDPIVAGAVSCHARFLVAYDRHLLDLQKPYGVSCVTPRVFVAALLKAP